MVPGIGPVEADDIVKGYEVDKGRYVLLSDEEIDNVKLEAKKSIDLVQFVESWATHGCQHEGTGTVGHNGILSQIHDTTVRVGYREAQWPA